MKKKIRFKTEWVKTTNGWTRWVNPKMKGYLLKCCDCGLVHEMDFEVLVTSRYKKERIATPITSKQFQIRFRARRAKT